MNPQQATRNVRGFDWRLAPLQRKLEWELDAARTRLARVLAQWQQARDGLEAAEERQEQAAVEARAQAAAATDPRAHRAMLSYLVGLGDQVAVARSQEQEAQERLAEGRQDVLRCQRRLDVLLRARGNALDDHLQAHARRDQSEADATWLALRELQRTAQRPGEGA